MLHNCCSSTWAQTAPAPTGATTVPRVRPWKPPLHAFVHEVQGPHESSTQSVSQALMLQSIVCAISPQASPSVDGVVSTVRVRVWTPGPHPWSQVDQLPHEDRRQLIGHDCSLHACTCMSTVSQWAPP